MATAAFRKVPSGGIQSVSSKTSAAFVPFASACFRCSTTTAAPKHLRLPMLPSIKEVLQMYQIRARRQLSQNFLFDMNLTRKIVSYMKITEESHVCEVGPGPGGITRAVLERFPRKLEVVEKDARFLPSLELLADASNGIMSVSIGDVLEHDFSNIFPPSINQPWDDHPPDAFVVGNLPFSVSTYLITRWLRAMCLREGPFACGRTNLVLTFQKEVGQRLVAPILDNQRCRLSAVCQTFSQPSLKFVIPGRAFIPSPKVDVAVVHFSPLTVPLIKCHFDLVEKVCCHLFHFRQKQCVRGIETLYPPEQRTAMAAELLRRARINPKVPSYYLSVEEIGCMCHVYEEQCVQNPGLFTYDYRAAENKEPASLPPTYPFYDT